MFDANELLDLWYTLDFYIESHSQDEIEEKWIKLREKVDKLLHKKWKELKI